VRRETQNILLVLLGGALLKIGINGDFLRYVRPAQQPWVIAGGAVMAVLGAVAIVLDLLAARRAAADVPAVEFGGHEHGHQHKIRSAWLLMVPVLAVFLIAPPALGADSVGRSQARAPQAAPSGNSVAFPPLPPGPVVPLSVSEFVTRSGWDSRGTLNGRTVSLSGFVVHQKGATLLARMVISCCAADAYPLTVRLNGPAAAGFPADAWVEATGEVVPGSATARDNYTPDLTLSGIRPVSAPRDPYEY
jgi:uncharacterized repeat protein (TIGR03943 family)